MSHLLRVGIAAPVVLVVTVAYAAWTWGWQDALYYAVPAAILGMATVYLYSLGVERKKS